jgi:hydroxymethylbilane synthase
MVTEVTTPHHSLSLGTRGSMLAKAQSSLVARELEQLHPGLKVELIIVSTSGDVIADRPLQEFGGKGLFTKELEQALLDGKVDFAVHSFKDVPVTMPLVEQSNLVIAAVPKREDARDLLVCHKVSTVRQLPAGSRVGTGSLRRRCQILAGRPDLTVEPIRGNIDTRVRKLQSGDYDAVILATAGTLRAGIFDPNYMHPIDLAELIPAAGQGALALQCRKDDHKTQQFLSAMNDPVTQACVTAERELVRLLNGDCHSPIAALARPRTEDSLTLRAAVGARGGEPPIVGAIEVGAISAPTELADGVFQLLRGQGASELLHGR